MPNTVLTMNGVTEEVQTLLGSSGVDVELSPADLKKSVYDALRTYNRNRPFRGNATLAVTTTQKKYGPIDILHPGFQGVIELKFVRTDIPGVGTVDPFNFQDQMASGMLIGCETFGERQQRMTYAQDVAKIASAETEYQGMWEEDGHYYLYVDVPRPGISVGYIWSGHYVFDVPTPTTPPGVLATTLIPDGDVDWVIDFSTARAKQILARIRGKFEGIPNPEGSVDQIDWTTLQQEGREDEERLKEEIRSRRRQLPPVVG